MSRPFHQPLLATAGMLVFMLGCRIESAAPGSSPTACAKPDAPAGELWVYTSMYRHVVDALEPVVKKALPDVTVHWYQAGSEKVAGRLEAELSAGGTQADVLLTSDPFLYERLKKEGKWLRYASANALRIPRALLDLDGNFAACRLSTMVLVHRAGVTPPKRFAELAEPGWKDEVVLGDPLTSGTGFTWAVFMEKQHGGVFFEALRRNGARVAGGNAAVLQKIEGGEAKAGVVLLENALAAKAKGSPIDFAVPEDGAILIPGHAAIFASSRNPVAAKALVDLILSAQGQEIIVRQGDMHAVDPRLSGPRGLLGLAELLEKSQPWDEVTLARGVEGGAEVKHSFSQAFAH
ncbi:MAG: ABC transporter substrate-binding protein [Myxococcota bacterium]